MGKINSVKCIKIHTPWHCNSTLSGINHAWMRVYVSKFTCDCVGTVVWKECEGEHTPAYPFHFILVAPPPPSLSFRVVRLDWSHPGKPSGIMLGYEVLRRTLRSCAAGSTGVTSSTGEELNGTGGLRFRCSYLQCPASHGVCGASCSDPDIQVIMLPLFFTRIFVFFFF